MDSTRHRTHALMAIFFTASKQLSEFLVICNFKNALFITNFVYVYD